MLNKLPRLLTLPLASQFRSLKLCWRFMFCCALITILSSCGSTPDQDDDPPPILTNIIPLANIEQEILDAETLSGEQRSSALLEITQSLVQHGEWDWARNTLSSLRANALTDDQFFDFSILSTQVSLAEGNPFIAKSYLWNKRFVDLFTYVHPIKKIQARELRATLLFDIAEFRACIKERLLLEDLFSGKRSYRKRIEANQDLIWQALMELPIEDLKLESKIHSDLRLSGWYTLAALSKNNQTNLRMQLEEVNNWALNWPEHPASLRLPADLQLLKQLLEEKAQRLAIMLPLTGKLAKHSQAIRDGMMAAFYHSSSQGDSLPDLRIYDTSRNRDINQLYDQAIAEGAEVVIGPLDKEKAMDLSLRPELPVPTLVLNDIESPISNTSNLFLFRLGVEDEAQQVAERAFRDGHRRALIIAPSSNWGDRNARTFAKTWQSLGGTVIRDYRFVNKKDYSGIIKEAFDISSSQNRARQIRRLVGQSIEFEPRRRQDVDLVFLAAYPKQARQIKPILAFHYAGNIPVYSTAQIYNGEVDSRSDQDMNAIRFATMPWFFDEALPEKQSINRFTSSAPSYQRFYALGVDAFHLYPRLKQLERVRLANFYGATGTLSLDENRRIKRGQTWAQFIRGRAYAMPTVVAKSDGE